MGLSHAYAVISFLEHHATKNIVDTRGSPPAKEDLPPGDARHLGGEPKNLTMLVVLQQPWNLITGGQTRGMGAGFHGVKR